MPITAEDANGRALSAVDIFSGCGGLTVGLKRAGFAVVGAVELDARAHATYSRNHPEVASLNRDVRQVRGQYLRALSSSSKIDLMAACPPCQGFCSLTAKWRRTDPRNRLIFEVARLIEETRPASVMVENVPGLAEADRGRRLFRRFVRMLESLGYPPEFDVLQVADYGVPQRRRRLVLLAGDGFKIALPKPTHSATGEGGLRRWNTLRSAIRGLPPPVTLASAEKHGGPAAFNWHIIRTLSPENQRRIRHARAGAMWSTIPRQLRPPCHKKGALRFRNVYGRMRWNEPSVTITGGCTTLSKGRFGHPRAHRTISIREAALLQTFPLRYEFEEGSVDAVCNMIGNALPCDFAAVLARQCASAIQRA